MRALAFGLLAGVVAVGCTTIENATCVPGEQAPCNCLDGTAGAQICTNERVYGACACIVPDLATPPHDLAMDSHDMAMAIPDLPLVSVDLAQPVDSTVSATTMSWTDQTTGTCDPAIYQRMAQIRDAMPTGPLTVKITATQVAPISGYGDWTATFPATTCVREWVNAMSLRLPGFASWTPGLCVAKDDTGTSYTFLYQANSGVYSAIIYPTGASDGQLMKVDLVDGSSAPCDLLGVNNRSGNDIGKTNAVAGGATGDTLSFTW